MGEIEKDDTVIYSMKEYRVMQIDYEAQIVRIVPVTGGQVLFVMLDQVYLCQKAKKTKN